MAFAATRLRRPNARTEGPPVFSQEFFIQNHADIVSCLCVVVFLGLLPAATNELASKIIFLQYNETVQLERTIDLSKISTSRIDTRPLYQTQYRHGRGDILNVIFYALIWIIIHAIIQEYIWEKTVKRLRLSKNKTTKYLDAGSMVVFYCVSLVMGVDHIIKGQYLINYGSTLFEGYPHDLMMLSLKFYMLVQMGFWIHCYPEIYLLKMKKEDVYSKLVQYTTSLLIIALSYVLYLQRLAIVLLVFHYGVEFVYYLSYLLECHGKLNLSQNGFMAWRYLFLLARVATIGLSIYTLGYGVTVSTNEEGQVVLYGVSLASPVVRFSALAIVVALQLWLLVTFINYQWMKVNKESHHGEPGGGATPTKNNKTKPTSPRQKKKN